MDNTTAHPAYPSSSSAGRPRRTRSALHVLLIVIGSAMALAGLGVLAGGGLMLAGQGIATDRDGFFEAPTETFESDGVAVVAADIELDADGDSDAEWLLNWLDVDVRLRVTGADSSDVFVGIARSSEIERYLRGASYSELDDYNRSVPRYDNVIGSGSVEPPLDQDFWVEQASGTDELELFWEPRSGQWSVVLMNIDGSTDVAADVDAAAKSGAITPIGVTLLVIGSLITVVAVAVIVVGARGRRAPGAPGPDATFRPDPSPNAAPAAPMASTPSTPTPPPPMPTAEVDADDDAHDLVGSR